MVRLAFNCVARKRCSFTGLYVLHSNTLHYFAYPFFNKFIYHEEHITV